MRPKVPGGRDNPSLQPSVVMTEGFRRFASKQATQIMPIRLLDVDEVSFKLHWHDVTRPNFAQSVGRVLHVGIFPKCPACHAECCLGHPNNGCEMRDIWDVSES